MEQTPSPARDPLVSIRTYRKTRAERAAACTGGLLQPAEHGELWCDSCGLYFCDEAEAKCHGARRKDILVEFAERTLELLREDNYDEPMKLRLIQGNALNLSLRQD